MKHTIFSVLFLLFVSAQAHAWVVKSDFEGGTVGEKTDTDASGSFFSFDSTTFSDVNPLAGKQSARATIPAGSGGWGDYGMFYKYPEVYQGGEIWARAWINYPKDFVWPEGPSGQQGKMMRIRTQKSSGDSERIFDIYPMETKIKIGHPFGPYPSVSSGNGPSGWEAFEMYIKFSSTKGIFRVWRNGVMVFEDTDAPTLGASSSYSAKLLFLTLYGENSSPVTQSVWIDDVIITNDLPSTVDAAGNPYIGIGDVVILAPPKPPTLIK